MLVVYCCQYLSLLFLLSWTAYSTGLPTRGDNAQQVEVGIDAKSMRFLQDKGYYVPSFSPDAGQIKSNREELSSSLRDFQRFANIPVTGKFDAETKVMMESPRCGMADQYKTSSRVRRYELQGSKWLKPVITWALENSNNDGITNDQVRVTMQRSFNKWQSVTNLQFQELVNKPINTADIRVRFVRGTHDDSYPFDGEGGTLAHAFYPHDNTGLAGDVHFDDDEKYSIDDNADRSKKKLLWVAVHELGHSIGLQHSNLKGAIMYPWYQHFEGSDFDLTDDDRLGVQMIYGGKETPVTSAPRTTTEPTRTVPVQTVRKSQCANQIGAVLYGRDGKTYIFNREYFYILKKSDEGMGVEEGPLLTSLRFKDLHRVDAVFRRPKERGKDNAMIVFFHDDMFSVYDGYRKEKESKLPRKISDGFEGLPEGVRDIDASYFDKKTNKLYLYKGDKYWRFSGKFNSVDFAMDVGYPQKIATRWRGLPSSVDAALSWEHDKVYFFKDDLYYRWNHRINAVHAGYPQKLSNAFLKCDKGAFQAQRKQVNDASGSNANGLLPSIAMLLVSCLFQNFVVIR